MSSKIETLVEEITDVDFDALHPAALIVWNDDHNTFEHVIRTLIKVCKHEPEQAEQCAMMVHYNGKCVVKQGVLRDLRPMKDAITERGIKATVNE